MDGVASDACGAETPPVAEDELAARDVGARIRSRREELGISREECAARFRVAAGSSTTTNTLARWEHHGRVNVAQARCLAGVLGVSPAWLLLGEDC